VYEIVIINLTNLSAMYQQWIWDRTRS